MSSWTFANWGGVQELIIVTQFFLCNAIGSDMCVCRGQKNKIRDPQTLQDPCSLGSHDSLGARSKHGRRHRGAGDRSPTFFSALNIMPMRAKNRLQMVLVLPFIVRPWSSRVQRIPQQNTFRDPRSVGSRYKRGGQAPESTRFLKKMPMQYATSIKILGISRRGSRGGRWVRCPPLGRRDPRRRRGFLRLKGRKKGH